MIYTRVVELAGAVAASGPAALFKSMFEVAAIVVALASAIANVTPTRADNRVLSAMFRAVHGFALNLDKLRARPQAPAAKKRAATRKRRASASKSGTVKSLSSRGTLKG